MQFGTPCGVVPLFAIDLLAVAPLRQPSFLVNGPHDTLTKETI